MTKAEQAWNSYGQNETFTRELSPSEYKTAHDAFVDAYHREFMRTIEQAGAFRGRIDAMESLSLSLTTEKDRP